MWMCWYSPGLSRQCALPYKLSYKLLPATRTEHQMTAVMPPVEIYTTRWCPYCHAAKALLKRKGVDFTEINVSGHSDRQAMIERADGRMTVPQIFIGPVHVGGSDDLHALERAGKLDPLLAGEGLSEGQNA